MAKETLLQKAKNSSVMKAKRYPNITKEHIDLALAWAKDEIRMTQVADVLGMKKANGTNNISVYIFLSKALKCYVTQSNKPSKK